LICYVYFLLFLDTTLKSILFPYTTLFRSLYKRYYEIVYSFIIKYLKSSELAEDVCQNTFFKIWERRNDLKITSFKNFALTVARNQAYDMLRKVSVKNEAVSYILSNYNYEVSSVEDEQQSHEYYEFIERILSSLPEQSRTIFKLCRQEHKTYDEVSKLLGISKNTVKKHMV